jgi:hypothetical protein
MEDVMRAQRVNVLPCPFRLAMLGLQCRTQTSMGSSRLPAFSDGLRLEMRESVFVF